MLIRLVDGTGGGGSVKFLEQMDGTYVPFNPGMDTMAEMLSTVPVVFSYWAKPDDALDLSELLNDHIAEVVANNPTRFAGLGTIPMQAPDLAIKELE